MKDTSKSDAEHALGKRLGFSRTFVGPDAFDAYHDAEAFCRGVGIHVGRMCSPEPTGLSSEYEDVAKWKNLSVQDRKCLDGVILGDFRNGPVTVWLSFDPVAADKAAEDEVRAEADAQD